MAEKIWIEIGNILKEERINKNITQQELADKIHVTRNCIANWETGRRKIDISELIKVCKYLGIDTNELINKVSKHAY